MGGEDVDEGWSSDRPVTRNLRENRQALPVRPSIRSADVAASSQPSIPGLAGSRKLCSIATFSNASMNNEWCSESEQASERNRAPEQQGCWKVRDVTGQGRGAAKTLCRARTRGSARSLFEKRIRLLSGDCLYIRWLLFNCQKTLFVH